MALRTLSAKTAVITLALAFMSSACAIQNWQPPAGPHDEMAVAAAKCDLFAQSGGQETFAAASGTTKFVGISMGAMVLASAIGNAARQARLYNDCMMANGWTPVARQ